MKLLGIPHTTMCHNSLRTGLETWKDNNLRDTDTPQRLETNQAITSGPESAEGATKGVATLRHN